jgi:protein-L-isoaspartate(D-aspartate) O-methyltransferase
MDDLATPVYYWHITVEDFLEDLMPLHIDFATARRAMIDSQLRPQGVSDPAILSAMASVPREDFVPEAVRPLAYTDRPLDLGNGDAMMPPAALGKLIAELEPRAGERALVVGTGNGYAARVLEALGLEVDNAGVSAPPNKTLYDLILIDGAVEEVPGPLVDSLASEGRLGTGLSDNGVTRLAIGRRAGKSLGFRHFADVQVPVLTGFTRPRAFTF